VVNRAEPLYLRKIFLMTRRLLIFSIFSIVFLQFSCLKTNQECEFKPCQFVAPTSEIQAVNAYLGANGLTATQHCSGLFYNIASLGSGKSPDGCSYVNVKYTGRTTSGVIFDQRTTTAVLINLNQVITGWRSGIPLLKEGGIMTLYVPPYLGYGSQELKDANGNVIVPGNSILIFDIELVTVER
jgi:FKBP-type peptidyl-prolyl cis-trans isomerase FkpA